MSLTGDMVTLGNTTMFFLKRGNCYQNPHTYLIYSILKEENEILFAATP